VIGFIGSSGRTRTYNPSVNSSQKGTATLLLPSVTKCFKTATDAPFLRIRHNMIALPSATETVPCLTDVGHRNGHTDLERRTMRQEVEMLFQFASDNHPIVCVREYSPRCLSFSPGPIQTWILTIKRRRA